MCLGMGSVTLAEREAAPNQGLQTLGDYRVRKGRGFPELGAWGNLQGPGSGRGNLEY